MKKYLGIIIVVLCTLLGAGIGNIISSQESIRSTYDTTIFMTVLSSDKNSSVEEKETASHFFAEAVLGWTLSPYFRESVGEVSSRKQERGNIVFEIQSKSEEDVKKDTEEFLNALEYKLQQYNNLANTQFRFLKDDLITTMNTPKRSMLFAAGAVAGFFLGLLIMEGWKIWRRKK